MLPVVSRGARRPDQRKSKMAILEKGEHPNTKKPLTAANLKDPKFMPAVKEKAAWEKNGATEIQLLDATDDWTKKNPDAAPGKLEEEILKHSPGDEERREECWVRYRCRAEGRERWTWSSGRDGWPRLGPLPPGWVRFRRES